MQEIIEQIFSYLRGIWRYRWYALLFAWLLCLGGWGFVYSMPDQYQSSARVYVDTQSILRPVLKGLALNTYNPSSQVSLMERTLLSRPNLEKVARMADLDLKIKDSADMEVLVNDLEDNIILERARGENLYTINYSDQDSQVAKKIVQSLLTVFVENTLGESRLDSNTAQRFLDKQIREYEARLLASEQRLKEFKATNMGMMPGSGGGYYERMQASRAGLEAVRLELQQTENRRDALQEQLEDEEFDDEELLFGMAPDMSQSVDPSTISLPIDARIASLRGQLDNLLMRFTEKHPEIIGLQDLIAQLEERREEELAQVLANRPPDATGNPVSQQIEIALAQEETNVAALRAQVEQTEQRIQELQKRSHEVLEVEAQLAALNRDYTVTRSNYSDLLSRREAAHITQQAEQTTDDIRFKVIDPPRVPLEPSGPNRPILMSVVLAVGSGAGLGLAFFMGQIRPVFDSRRNLMNATNAPVFGTVGMVISPNIVRRQRLEMVVYVFLGTCLLALYGGLLLLQVIGFQLF